VPRPTSIFPWGLLSLHTPKPSALTLSVIPWIRFLILCFVELSKFTVQVVRIIIAFLRLWNSSEPEQYKRIGLKEKPTATSLPADTMA
jgi:hypothetical protein